MNRLLIWGTGIIAKELISNGIEGQVVGFIETNKTKNSYNELPVYGISEIPNQYDYIIVANTFANAIYKTCIEYQIDLNKVVFLFPVNKRVGITELSEVYHILGEKNYTNYCARVDISTNTFFEEDLKQYQHLNTRKNFEVKKEELWPIIYDKYRKAGTVGNYFWQDLWAAKKICKSGVKNHFDIGSRIDGFIAHLLAADIDVTIIDIREFPEKIEKLHTIVDDATLLKEIPENSLESISALCSLEHFGLGRYGDPIDPEACFKCFEEIQKRIKSKGNLYIAVPVGKEKVEFNAHRVFYASTIIECFHNMDLVEYSCTADGKIEYNVDIHKYDNDNHNGEFRFGLFHFVKQ